jgi:phage tail-like protein
MSKHKDDAPPIHRFYLEIDKATKAVFMQIDGLQVETEIFEYAEGGNNGFVHKLPGQTRVGNLTLKSGLVADNKLFNWYMAVARGTIETKNISVMIYSHDGSVVRRWSFTNAYPVRWVGPTFSVDSNEPAVEMIEFAHSGMQLESKG